MPKSDVSGKITHQETEDDACWQRIKESFDPCCFEQFAIRFPDSPHASAACFKSEVMIRTCEEWTQLEQFLRDYNSSERTPLALSRLSELDLIRLGTQSGGIPLLTLLRNNVQNSLSFKEQIGRLRSAFGPSGFYVFASVLLAIALYVLLPRGPKTLPGTLETDAKVSRELHSSDASPEDKDFRVALQAGTREALETYLRQNPSSFHAGNARHALEKLDDEAFGSAERARSVEAYRDYMSAWPNGRNAAAGRAKISDLEALITDDKSFESAKNSARREALEAYLAAHAKGLHVAGARYALAQLDTAAYQAATKINNLDAYRNYLQTCPNGQHRAAAELHISELETNIIEDNNDFVNATTLRTKSALEAYLGNHPQGRHASEAAEKLDELEAIAYESSLRVNTNQSYQDYLGAWPNGRHMAMANVRLSELKEGQLADDQAFKVAKEQNTKEALGGYLMSNGHGLHAREAQESLDALEATAYETAERTNTEQSYQDYLGAWPNGRHMAMANVRLSELKEGQLADDQAFKVAKEQNTKEALGGYLMSNGHGLHAREAQESLDALEATAYETAERTNTEQSYQDYLGAWPNGRHMAMANVRLSELKEGQLADDQAFRVAQEKNTQEALEGYIAFHTHGLHTREVQKSLDALEATAYKAAERADSIKAYESFLSAWPQGAHKSTASRRLSEARTYAEKELLTAAKKRK